MRFSHFIAGLTFAAVNAVVAQASAVPSDAHYARGATNVFWFMHVSDLHSGTCVPSGTSWDARLRRVFVFSKVIDPWFILATGDLVEGGKGMCLPTAGQAQSEWDKYKSIYEEAKVAPSFYFDLPGNHDGYDDKGMTYYLKNSLQGRTNGKTIVSWTVDLPLGQYLFLGLNSAGNGSGPAFEDPEFRDDQMAEIRQVLKANPKARLRVFAAHHHVSGTDRKVPVNSDKVIDLMKSDGGSYYLHGHRHDCGEYLVADGSIVVNQIATLGKGKENNIGIAVIDHDGFTYRATNTEKPWPFVIVTAPWGMDLRGEDYDYKLGDQGPEGRINPNAYSVCKDRKDNPVRALVFSDVPPTSVTATVHGVEPVAMKQSKVAPQIWEAEVDTTSIDAGITSIKVVAKVKDKIDAEHTIRVKFDNGPCDKDLPIDPDPPETGGSGGAGGSGGGGAGGAAGSGGTPPVGGAGGDDSSGGMGGGVSGGAGGAPGGGAGGAAGTGGVAGMSGTAGIAGSASGGKAGADGGTEDGSIDLGGDDYGGGCSCEVGVGASNGASRTVGAAWLALLGMVAVAVRRRRAQSFDI